MDAMTHAIEGYVSTDWSPHQDARSLHALRMIRDNLERAVERGEEDEEARGNMLIAANLAITIALGSVHAMSHPAGAQFGVPHGVANAIHLPHVIRHNAAGGPEIADRYRDVAELFDVRPTPDVGDALAAHVTELSRAGSGCRRGCPRWACPEAGIPALVEGAMGDGTTLLNPREMGEEDYARALPQGALAAAGSRVRAATRLPSSVRRAPCAAGASRAACAPGRSSSAPACATEWSQATASGTSGSRVDDLGGGVDRELRDRHRVPAERVGEVATS